jgi:uncharacterized coiled-coil protein SlyX
MIWRIMALILAATFHWRLARQERILSEIDDTVKAEQAEIDLQTQEISELLGVNQQLLEQARDAVANATTAETRKRLADLIASTHANTVRIREALAASSASGQANVSAQSSDAPAPEAAVAATDAGPEQSGDAEQNKTPA